MVSPTQKTLALLKKDGHPAQVVERFNMFAHVRIDLFGYIDVVALRTGIPGVLGIQATSRENVNKRVEKIISIPTAKTWLECGNQIEVWGWSKKGKAGKRKLWEVFKQEIKLEDLNQKVEQSH